MSTRASLSISLNDDKVAPLAQDDMQRPKDAERGGHSDAADMENRIPEKPVHFDPRQNPDGGLQAWLCVLGGFCCLFCSFGWINVVGVFQAYYQTHQLRHDSASTIAWIPSLETFFMFFFGPLIGKFYDNYGPRWLLITGSVLEVFGIMMISLSTKYYQFILSQGVCSSIGASMIFYPALSTIPTWFFRKRAFAFGIMAAGSSLGGVILPIMVQRLIPEVGFPWAIRITAFLILFMLIIANLTVTSRAPPRPSRLDPLEFVRPFKELPFDLLVFGAFIFYFGFMQPITYIIIEATSHHMSPQLAQYLVSILNAGSLLGRVMPGYIADKIGRFNMLIIMCGFTGIVVLALWLPGTSNAAIIVFAALFGFGSGAFVSLAPSCVAQISEIPKIGVRSGVFFSVTSVAALVANPIGGQILALWKGSYTGLQIFAGVMCLAGTLSIVLARIRIAGVGFRVKV